MKNAPCDLRLSSARGVLIWLRLLKKQRTIRALIANRIESGQIYIQLPTVGSLSPELDVATLGRAVVSMADLTLAAVGKRCFVVCAGDGLQVFDGDPTNRASGLDVAVNVLFEQLRDDSLVLLDSFGACLVLGFETAECCLWHAVHDYRATDATKAGAISCRWWGVSYGDHIATNCLHGNYTIVTNVTGTAARSGDQSALGNVCLLANHRISYGGRHDDVSDYYMRNGTGWCQLSKRHLCKKCRNITQNNHAQNNSER